MSPNGDVDTTSAARLGADWRILHIGINVKLYPMCFGTHRIIDAMIDLCRAHRLRAADIASVDVELGEAQAAMLRNHHAAELRSKPSSARSSRSPRRRSPAAAPTRK